MPVYADLSALVRRHPGWSSLNEFNAMQTRLELAARQMRSRPAVPVALTLPAQGGMDLPGTAFTMPAADLDQERRQLAEQAQAQLDRLRARRAAAREQQLRLQDVRWRREAQLQYTQAVEAAQAQYTAHYNDAFAATDVRRVNLTLQIHALEKLIQDWTLSTPPAPRLVQARAELSAKTAELKRLETERAGTLGTLRGERDRALAQAAAARDAYVTAQRAQSAEALQTQDEALLASQRAQLTRQTALLLRQQQVLAAGDVAVAGTVGAVSVPPARGAQGPVRNLDAAARRLQAQRDRWIAFLYDDTKAAAQDAARQRGWKVTFDPSHRGETNVTARLAGILAGSVWKN